MTIRRRIFIFILLFFASSLSSDNEGVIRVKISMPMQIGGVIPEPKMKRIKIKIDDNPYPLIKEDGEIFIKNVPIGRHKINYKFTSTRIRYNPKTIYSFNVKKDTISQLILYPSYDYKWKSNDKIELLLQNIASEDSIYKLLLTSMNKKFNIRAIDQITDDQLLYNLILNTKNDLVSVIAANRLSNENLMYTMMINTGYRCDFIHKIKDKKILLKIFEKIKDKTIHSDQIEIERLLKKINNQEMIEKYARIKPDSTRPVVNKIKISAIKLLKNQELLKKIFEKNKDKWIRQAALGKIDDNKYLKKYYSIYPTASLRSMTDGDFLYNIIKNDTTQGRKAASSAFNRLRILKDKKYLNLLLNDYYFHLKKSTDIISAIGDQDLLKSIFSKNYTTNDQLEAIKYIADESFLKSLVLSSYNREIEEQAIINIHNKAYLKEIYDNFRFRKDSKYMRLSLIRHISDIKTLKYISEIDELEKLRKRAKKKMEMMIKYYEGRKNK